MAAPAVVIDDVHTVTIHKDLKEKDQNSEPNAARCMPIHDPASTTLSIEPDTINIENDDYQDYLMTFIGDVIRQLVRIGNIQVHTDNTLNSMQNVMKQYKEQLCKVNGDYIMLTSLATHYIPDKRQ